MKQQSEEINKNKIFLLLVFLAIFVIAGIALSLIGKKGGKKPTGLSVTLTPTTILAQGSFKLQTVSDARRFPAGQPVTFTVVADSAGEEIVGWDLLVAYDPTAWEFIKASSLASDFKIYSYKRGDHISFTVIKSLESKIPSVFKNTKVASLVFQPKKRGSFTLTLKDNLGREKTQLVTGLTKRLFPKLDQITLEIY